MQHQAKTTFLDKLLHSSGSSWLLRSVLAVFILWAGVAPLLGINDFLELGMTMGSGIIILSLVYVLMRMRKRNLDSLHLTLQEFIFTNKVTRSIDLHDLTNEQIENLRSELRAMCDGTDIPFIERSYRERKNDTPVNAQAGCRMAA